MPFLISGNTADLPRVTDTLDFYQVYDIEGDLADLPRATNKMHLNTVTGLYGDLSDLPPVMESVQLLSLPLVYGNIASLGGITKYLYIQSDPLVVGDVQDLPPCTDTLNVTSMDGITGDFGTVPTTAPTHMFRKCPLTGALAISNNNTIIEFYGNDSVTPAEYDQTIANCVAAGGTGRTLYISSRRTSASDADVATLRSRGWTVNDSNI